MFKNWSKKFNYKFKDLKPYGSLENLYKGNRKYRRVFDESECRYINVELSFYNILFDEEDWETEVTLRAVNQKTGKEISSIKKNIKVTQDQNIVYVREGWGTPDPGFWKKDSYKWEAYIDGKLVGQANFYVMNSGQVAPNENPYFNIKSIRLYESPYEGTPIEQRTYLQTFDHETTRYINVEMQLENLIIEEPHFPLELQFNVYNDTRHLKAHMTHFKNIYDKRKDIVLDTGYGTQNVGFWYEDEYIMEVLFMDELI